MAKPTIAGLLGFYYDGGIGDRWIHNGDDWVKTTTSDATGFASIDEGNGLGLRPIGRDLTSTGNIGLYAIDASYAEIPLPITPAQPAGQDKQPEYPAELGATGKASFAFNESNLASGPASTAGGMHSEASGPASFAWGETAKATGVQAFALGQFALAAGAASFAVGVNSITHNNFTYAIGNCNTGVSGAPIEFGIGAMNYNGTVLGDRKNGLELFADGTVNAPSSTVTAIDARGDKTLITREYLQAKAPPMPESITWGELLAKQAAGTVVVWDKYIITDNRDLRVEIKFQDDSGMHWFEKMDVEGDIMLVKLDIDDTRHFITTLDELIVYPFNILITSPTLPAVSAAGGATLVDNGDGTYSYISEHIVTSFSVGSPATKVEVLAANDVTGMGYSFSSVVTLTELVIADGAVDKVTTMESMCHSCPALTSVTIGKTPSLRNLQEAFMACTALTSFSFSDLSLVTNFYGTWRICTSLTSFPAVDFKGATAVTSAWERCDNLVCFQELDLSSVTDGFFAFYESDKIVQPPAVGTSVRDDISATQGTWTNPGACPVYPYHVIITSPTTPVVPTIPGAVLTDNGDGTWTLVSAEVIESSDHAWSSTNATKIEIIAMHDMLIMDYAFSRAEFLQEMIIADGAIPKVSSLLGAWSQCSALTSFTGDTPSITDFSYAWEQCESLVDFHLTDTSDAVNLTYAWNKCTALTSFPMIDTSKVTDFKGAWGKCQALESFPQLDTSSGTTFNSTWNDCRSLTDFPPLDLSKGTNFYATWQYCLALTSFPPLDMSSGKNFMYCWYKNSSLLEFPLVDVSSGTIFNYTWGECTSLVSFPSLDTSSGVDFRMTWSGNAALICMDGVDFSSADEGKVSGTFSLAYALVKPAPISNARSASSAVAGETWTNPDPCPEV